MTPKEKAIKLIDKFIQYTPAEEAFELLYAKQCALIAVDEALNVFIEVHKALQTAGLLKCSVKETATYKFWQEVKQEIEKL